jgi:hypothetical protein
MIGTAAAFALYLSFAAIPAASQQKRWVADKGSDPVAERSSNYLSYGQDNYLAPSYQVLSAAIPSPADAGVIQLRKSIEAYRDFHPGWDGGTAEVPSAIDIDDAITFLGLLKFGTPLPQSMISSSGTIGLYWDQADKYADLELEGNGAASLFISQKDSLQPPVLHEFLLTDVTPDQLGIWLQPFARALH